MGKNGAFGPGFHHVAIRATNFEASVRFYEEGLGLVRKFGWGEGDSRAALMDMGDGNYVEIFTGRGDGEIPEGGILHFALRTSDTDAAYARAMAAGATSIAAPKDATPAHADRPLTFRIAFIRGPAGETIEFFQNDEL